MSESSPRSAGRVPQTMLLLAAAGLIVLMILLGTEAIELDGPVTIMIAGGLFSIGLFAAAMILGTDQQGPGRTPPRDE